jgi:hypothetical protein
MQQWHYLKDKGIDKPNPRKQMLFDLAARVAEIKERGEEVIIMMDSNESLNDSRAALTKWLQGLGLVDIIAQHHGSNGEPETYNRGTERIDHIFMTPTLAEFVHRTGILGYNEVTMSDHRTLYADIDLARYLGGEPSALESKAGRGIVSSDPRAVKVYRSQLEACLDESNLEEETDKLLESIVCNDGKMNGNH